MSDRQLFLDAITSNPRDMDLRKVYADWLDENDCPEQADIQRTMTIEQYQEAESWMVDFASYCSSYTDDGYSHHFQTGWEPDDSTIRRATFTLTKEQLLQKANEWLDNGEYWTQWGFEGARDRMYNDEEIFWKHFQTLTGRFVPDDKKSNFISCSC